MDKNFLKLKRKYLIAALLKSAVCALGAAAVAFGAMLIADKFSGVEMLWYYFAAAIGGAAVIAFAVAFVALRPTDRKVAKSLDEEYRMDERARTALAFKNESGFLYEMQREDASAKFADVRVREATLSKIWKYLVAALLAVAVAVGCILVPSPASGEEPETPPDDVVVSISESQKIRLQELIAEVQKSNFADDVKTDVTAELNGLVDALDEEMKFGALRSTVINSRAAIAEIVESYQSYAAIADALAASGATDLSDAVRGGGGAYVYYDATEYSHVEVFYSSQMYAAVEEGMAKGYTALSDSLKISKEEVIPALFLLTDSVIGGLMQLDDSYIDDGLYVILTVDFGLGLNGLISECATLDDTATQNKISDFLGSKQTSISAQLEKQTYSLLMSRYVRNRLALIFPELNLALETAETKPTEPTQSGSDGNSGGDDEGGSGGGGGTGEMQYGSKDEIYDFSSGSYKKYTELLGQYSSSQESISEEQKELIDKFFEYLYNTGR